MKPSLWNWVRDSVTQYVKMNLCSWTVCVVSYKNTQTLSRWTTQCHSSTRPQNDHQGHFYSAENVRGKYFLLKTLSMKLRSGFGHSLLKQTCVAEPYRPYSALSPSKRSTYLELIEKSLKSPESDSRTGNSPPIRTGVVCGTPPTYRKLFGPWMSMPLVGRWRML